MASIITRSTRDNALLKFLSEIGRELFGSYRPEKHYMRGPAHNRGHVAAGNNPNYDQQLNPDLHRR